ncbi:hypothetical protein THMIRHAM_06460 [Thiomicrorhabdus immobilis]|uniref:Transposase n=1 Tax=Thiomicrorhabdus immobilis TaxID=2791037 RepID=A0ABM7MC03_9GAMM|nr:hypothetical protein THMIRHAM_06460 [Thiomicrorhabdus immobilis]
MPDNQADILKIVQLLMEIRAKRKTGRNGKTKIKAFNLTSIIIYTFSKIKSEINMTS